MADICLKCAKGWIAELQVGDKIVEEKDCSNCHGDKELQKSN